MPVWRKKKVPPPVYTKWSAKVGPYNFKVIGVDTDTNGVTYRLSAVAMGRAISLATTEHVRIFDAAGNLMVDIEEVNLAGPVTAAPGSEVVVEAHLPHTAVPSVKGLYTAAPQGTWSSGISHTHSFQYQAIGANGPLQINPFGNTGPLTTNPIIPPNSVTVNQPRPRDTPKDDEHTFRDALIGHKVYTYELADGELIYGEFGWVTDLEYFDDRDGEIVLKRKRWLLLAEDEVILPDPHAADDDE